MNAVTVKLWKKDIGYLIWDESLGLASFQYDESFVPSGRQIAPLTMPLSNTIFKFPELSRATYQGLPGCFADSLPDKYGNQIMEQWRISKGKSRLNPLEKLSFIGTRGMGALEYHPSTHRRGSSESLEIDSLIQVAKEILSQRSLVAIQHSKDDPSKEEALRHLISVGTSAGGARSKALIAYNSEKQEIRSGQVKAPKGFKYYLIKFDGISQSDKEDNDPLGFGIMEYVYHLMAKEAEIDISNCLLYRENDRSHFMTERFDRLENGEKVHMQSLCAMAHQDFNLARATGYEQAFQTCRDLNLPISDFDQLFRRMVFNVIARNQDDHTKNIAFLMDKYGKWRLAPAFDICFSYNPIGDWTSRHQMTICGKADNFTKNDLITIATLFDIKKPEDIIHQVSDAVSSWRKHSAEHGVSPINTNHIEKHFRMKW